MGDRLQQTTGNLLTSAIQFTFAPCSTTVKRSTLHNEDIADAEIQIIDKSIGIAPEFPPHVFDRFCQAESGFAGKVGLGLAIAHQVELYNGTTDAYSAGAGQGATLLVRLPLLKR